MPSTFSLAQPSLRLDQAAAAAASAAAESSSLEPEEISVKGLQSRTYGDELRLELRSDYEAVHEMYEILYPDPEHPKRRGLETCRNYAWFVRNVHTNEVRVHAVTCRQRWCPLCARAKARNVGANVEEWTKHLDRPKLLTLTLRSTTEPLPDQLDRLRRCFTKFRTDKVLKRWIHGGIYFFQVTWNEEENRWHPHLHAICDMQYVDQKYLSKVWLSATGDSPIVDVRQVNSPKFASYYVSRYVSRPCDFSDLPRFQRSDLHYAFANKRLCGTWGSAIGARLHATPKFDPADWHRVGTWETVHLLAVIDPDARAVLHSYETGVPLDPDITIRSLEFETDFGEDQRARSPPERQGKLEY